MKRPVEPLQRLFPTSLLKPVVLAGCGLLAGQWILSDLIHLPGGGVGLLAAAGGIWWWRRGSVRPRFTEPESLDGWMDRCLAVLEQFRNLEDDAAAAEQRTSAYEAVINRDGPLRLALVGVDPVAAPQQTNLEKALAGAAPLTVSLCRPLDPNDGRRIWPRGLHDQDLILFSLRAPLLASNLLWLQELPEKQPVWLLVISAETSADRTEDESSDCTILASLQANLPARLRDRVLLQRGSETLRSTLAPLRREINQSNFRTRQRLLADLHRQWLGELEALRRSRFQVLQNRTQWLVAGSVLASPLPSLDLVAMAVANGLMIHEMREIWGTSINPELMREAAEQLAKTALAQGVVEWTSQMLLGLAKLETGSWLVAGAMQALSAAYLTRVVGRSMADWLALTAGVAEPDLLALKQQAPLLVARAAEEERLNWSGFLKQSREWMLHATS